MVFEGGELLLLLPLLLLLILAETVCGVDICCRLLLLLPQASRRGQGRGEVGDSDEAFCPRLDKSNSEIHPYRFALPSWVPTHAAPEARWTRSRPWT